MRPWRRMRSKCGSYTQDSNFGFSNTRAPGKGRVPAGYPSDGCMGRAGAMGKGAVLAARGQGKSGPSWRAEGGWVK